MTQTRQTKIDRIDTNTDLNKFFDRIYILSMGDKAPNWRARYYHITSQITRFSIKRIHLSRLWKIYMR